MQINHNSIVKTKNLVNSKIGSKWQLRQSFSRFRQYTFSKQLLTLNTSMAINWKKMHTYQYYFNLWTKYKHTQ